MRTTRLRANRADAARTDDGREPIPVAWPLLSISQYIARLTRVTSELLYYRLECYEIGVLRERAEVTSKSRLAFKARRPHLGS